jgi:hypothetical protein
VIKTITIDVLIFSLSCMTFFLKAWAQKDDQYYHSL